MLNPLTGQDDGIPVPGQIPSAPPMPVMSPPKASFDKTIGLPPPASANTQQYTPPAPLPPMPPSGSGGTPAYIAQQSAEMDKYGPEQQQAVEQAILKRRQGLGATAGNAMTGMADALMQGVARAGPSNFQSNLNARNDKTEELMRSSSEKFNTGKLAQMKTRMELSTNDPTSPLSRSQQRANALTLKGLGYKDSDIAEIPAASMADVLAKRISLEEVKSRAEEAKALHELQAGTAGRSLAEIHAKNVADEKARVEALNQRVKESAVAHPVATAIQGVLSGDQTPGPLGEETIRNGKTYVWSPTTKAYHLKQ